MLQKSITILIKQKLTIKRNKVPSYKYGEHYKYKVLTMM
jgi:hypothetical protein